MFGGEFVVWFVWLVDDIYGVSGFDFVVLVLLLYWWFVVCGYN